MRLKPSITSSGIFASRSICSASTSLTRNSRSVAKKASPFSIAAASSRGCGWIRSSRKLPRKSSLPKLGSFHSCSRAASATCRASRSLTFVAIQVLLGVVSRGMSPTSFRAVGLAALLTVGLAAPAAADHDFPSPGAPSLNDRLFPGLGNGGYDVQHYTLDLDYGTTAAVQTVPATVTIEARATQALSRFDLDFAGDTVRKVSVEGRPAAFAV